MQDFFDVQKKAIYGRNGTEFMFKGLKINIESIKSMEDINLCLIMQAETISEDSLKDLLPTIREAGSETWLEWNPQFDSDPVRQRFIVDPPKSTYVCQADFSKNPWFSNKSRRNMEYDKKRDYDLYLNVWKGHTMKRSDALVFKHYRVDGSISPPDDAVLYFGADFGFSNDPSTLVRMWIDDDKRELYIDYEAYEHGVQIDHYPAFYDRIPGARKWKITADGARPEIISYLKRQGFKIFGAKKGKGSVDEGVKFLQSYNIVIHPRCKHTIAEIGNYKWKVDPKTNEVLDVLQDEDNHVIDACRYALESVKRNVRIHIG